MIEKLKTEWFSNIGSDTLAGIVVALALIPEAISFSIIAGLDPMIGLYSSFCIAVITAFAGGRPGMISAATGAMALLMVPLVKQHGLDYLLAATILTGLIQFIFGLCKIDKAIKIIPRSVMIGFVNALAILIFMAQIPYFLGVSNMAYVFLAITLLIMYTLPKIVKSVPAPLVAIVLLTAVSIFMNLDLQTVGNLGAISKSLPKFFIPNVPFSIETLAIIFPYSIALSIVGLLESLMTASLLDDLTSTDSDKNKEARGQGIANIVAGFFGGMAGCAMIGQSMINIKSGGRGRLSTFIAGVFLMFLIIVLGDYVVKIPMPVLAGIMIMVSIGTFDWSTFSYLKKAPKSDAFVMLMTVLIVVATHDLSKGVIAGVLLSALFFIAKVSKIQVIEQKENENILFDIKGFVFFASVHGFLESFDFTIKDSNIIIDFSNAHVLDCSAVGSVDKAVIKYRANNNTVIVRGLNEHSKNLIDSLAIYHDEKAELAAH